MQVDPIKPMLELPGTKRLKLNCDHPLSNLAFNFNLRRFTKAFMDKAKPNFFDLFTFRTIEYEAGTYRGGFHFKRFSLVESTKVLRWSHG